MSWENKTIYFIFFSPVYFSPFTKYFTKSSGKVYAYQITRTNYLGYSLGSFLLCGLEEEILTMLFSLEQKHCWRQKYSINSGNWCVQQVISAAQMLRKISTKQLWRESGIY